MNSSWRQSYEQVESYNSTGWMFHLYRWCLGFVLKLPMDTSSSSRVLLPANFYSLHKKDTLLTVKQQTSMWTLVTRKLGLWQWTLNAYQITNTRSDQSCHDVYIITNVWVNNVNLWLFVLQYCIETLISMISHTFWYPCSSKYRVGIEVWELESLWND